MGLKKYQHCGDRGACYRPNAGGCRQSAPMRDKPRKERHPNPLVGDLVHVDWVRDVFYAVGPAVREEKVGLSARLVVDAPADAYRSRRSQGLKPSRDIDAVSVNVALIDEDVARIDSDPQLHSIRLIRLTRSKSALDIEGATYRIHPAHKPDQQSVAHPAHQTPAILFNRRVNQFTPMARNARMRLVLTTAHHAAVVDDIGKHHCR